MRLTKFIQVLGTIRNPSLVNLARCADMLARSQSKGGEYVTGTIEDQNEKEDFEETRRGVVPPASQLKNKTGGRPPQGARK